jgi:hypothetical protein
MDPTVKTFSDADERILPIRVGERYANGPRRDGRSPEIFLSVAEPLDPVGTEPLEALKGFEYVLAGKPIQVPRAAPGQVLPRGRPRTCRGRLGVPPTSPERPIQYCSAQIRLIMVGLAQFRSNSLYIA